MVSQTSPTIKVTQEVKDKLDILKVHPNQSYSDVLEGLLIGK
jgi:predicted CopG family antitoxin